MSKQIPPGPDAAAPGLKRSLNLPLLVLYGLGTTIGAGIYVLVGATAGRAGVHAPIAFVVAVIALIPTAASYSELAGRYPVSAGEAAYARAGYKSRWISMATGWLVILSAVVASAAVANGSAGYIRTFVDLPISVLVTVVILCMGAAAAWGIMESVLLAALFTLIEAGGLIGLVILGFANNPDLIGRLPEILPPVGSSMVWIGITNAGLLAIFAFIGFEDIVNVSEETKKPRTTVPWAIFLTVMITTLLYTLVSSVAVLTVAPKDLAGSGAPLSLVFQTLTGGSPAILSAIAVFATLNTVLVQFIMASRVVYGMAVQETLPTGFARINPTTRTPVLATAAIVAATLVLAVAFPLEQLAESTSIFILVIWVLINGALVMVKLRGEPATRDTFVVPFWVPVVGMLFCISLVAASAIG